jgi:type IV pilus assembly protein PilW
MGTMTLHETLKQRRSEQGFTLIELMIAMGIFALLAVAAFAVIMSGQRTAMLNDQTVKVQQSARLALDLMSRDIRMAGYGNNANIAALPAGPCNTARSPIVATDPTAGTDVVADTISVATIDSQVGQLAARAPFPPALTADRITVSLPTTIAAGDVITLEGIFTTVVGAVNNVTGEVIFTAGLPTIQSPMVFMPGAAVIKLACVTYAVTGPLAVPPSSPFQLTRALGGNAAVPIVDGIETIQLAYGLDVNGDDRIDDQNLDNTFDCLDFVPNNVLCGPLPAGTILTIPIGVNATPTFVRQVRLTVVARAIPPANANIAGNCWRDPTFTGSAQVQAEDQQLSNASASVPAACNLPAGGIRRRALTRVIALRDVTQ